MIDDAGFKTWLIEKTGRRPIVAKDITSRMKRADRIIL